MTTEPGVASADSVRRDGAHAQTRRAVAQFPPPGGTPNPYADLLYAALAERGLPRAPLPDLTVGSLWLARRSVAFLHFHWRPDRYYARCLYAGGKPGFARRGRAAAQVMRFALLLGAARLLGYRIVWTVHEVYPPRGWTPGLAIDRVGQRLLAGASSLMLAHDRAVADKLRAELGSPRLRIELIPHGSFIGAYPAGRTRAQVRREVGIPGHAFVFLCFGQLRADKQVGLLLDAFARVRSPDVALLVAGAPADARSMQLVQDAARADVRIRALLHAIPHARVSELFDAADVFVLARGEAWTSGSLVLALSQGLPAIAARSPRSEGPLNHEGAGWLFHAGDVESLSEALERAASDRALANAKGMSARAWAEALPSWQEIARRIAGLLRVQQ